MYGSCISITCAGNRVAIINIGVVRASSDIATNDLEFVVLIKSRCIAAIDALPVLACEDTPVPVRVLRLAKDMAVSL